MRINRQMENTKWASNVRDEEDLERVREKDNIVNYEKEGKQVDMQDIG